ncbi:hypothetical protein MTP99_001823 [Tenebrio molitor]|nr:hypothetical protein MTP99_001823 [Tenebrio molitor]
MPRVSNFQKIRSISPFESGMSYRQISEELGVPKSTATRYPLRSRGCHRVRPRSQICVNLMVEFGHRPLPKGLRFSRY